MFSILCVPLHEKWWLAIRTRTSRVTLQIRNRIYLYLCWYSKTISCFHCLGSLLSRIHLLEHRHFASWHSALCNGHYLSFMLCEADPLYLRSGLCFAKQIYVPYIHKMYPYPSFFTRRIPMGLHSLLWISLTLKPNSLLEVPHPRGDRSLAHFLSWFSLPPSLVGLRKSF